MFRCSLVLALDVVTPPVWCNKQNGTFRDPCAFWNVVIDHCDWVTSVWLTWQVRSAWLGNAGYYSSPLSTSSLVVSSHWPWGWPWEFDSNRWLPQISAILSFRSRSWDTTFYLHDFVVSNSTKRLPKTVKTCHLPVKSGKLGFGVCYCFVVIICIVWYLFLLWDTVLFWSMTVYTGMVC